MAASIAGVFWRAARPSDLAYRHTRNPYICIYINVYIYTHTYRIHVYRPWRMAFEIDLSD